MSNVNKSRLAVELAMEKQASGLLPFATAAGRGIMSAVRAAPRVARMTPGEAASAATTAARKGMGTLAGKAVDTAKAAPGWAAGKAVDGAKAAPGMAGRFAWSTAKYSPAFAGLGYAGTQYGLPLWDKVTAPGRMKAKADGALEVVNKMTELDTARRFGYAFSPETAKYHALAQIAREHPRAIKYYYDSGQISQEDLNQIINLVK